MHTFHGRQAGRTGKGFSAETGSVCRRDVLGYSLTGCVLSLNQSGGAIGWFRYKDTGMEAMALAVAFSLPKIHISIQTKDKGDSTNDRFFKLAQR